MADEATVPETPVVSEETPTTERTARARAVSEARAKRAEERGEMQTIFGVQMWVRR